MRTDSDNQSLGSRWWWLTIALISAGYLLWTYGLLRHELTARWQDTSGYLAHALYIAERGGLWGFLRECFTGTFPLTERHPLYFLLLAPFAERSAEFFWQAKVFNLVTGLLVLLSLVWMVARRYGRGPAIIAGLVYALSRSLVTAAAHVDNEPLFVLCTLWTWWFLTEPAPGATGASRELPPVTLWRWAAAGAGLGLAYLTKSPAILMVVAVLVAVLWQSRLRAVLDRRLWAMVAVALLVASPLLVRNVLGYGTLLYEGVNSNIMWIDDWSEIGDERSVIYYDHYGVTTIEVNGMPTAAQYWQTHSLQDIANRLGYGLYLQLRTVIATALGPDLSVPRGRTLGFAVLALALGGWWLRRRSWEGTLVFFWSGAFLAFFSWDTMFPDIRYLAPLIPVWIAYAAHAAWTVGTRWLKPASAMRTVAISACLVTFAALGWTAHRGAYASPQPLMEMTPSYMRFIGWVQQHVEPGDRIMVGETRKFHGLIWLVDRPVNVLLMSDSRTLDGFLKYLRDRKTRYLLMHSEYLTGANQELAAELAPYFAASPDGAIVETQPLPGWRRIYADSGPAPQFILYEALP